MKNKREMTAFMVAARKKGYTQRLLADRWEYKSTQSIAKIAENPKKRHWDMLAGCPEVF